MNQRGVEQSDQTPPPTSNADQSPLRQVQSLGTARAKMFFQRTMDILTAR